MYILSASYEDFLVLMTGEDMTSRHLSTTTYLPLVKWITSSHKDFFVNHYHAQTESDKALPQV